MMKIYVKTVIEEFDHVTDQLISLLGNDWRNRNSWYKCMVTRDVSPWAVVAGYPARVLRQINKIRNNIVA